MKYLAFILLFVRLTYEVFFAEAYADFLEGTHVRYQQTGDIHYQVIVIDEFIRRIVVFGTLNHGDNIEYFHVTEQNSSTPFIFSVDYDLRSEDLEPDDDTIGRYVTVGLPTLLTFGGWQFYERSSEVRIYHGHEGFWGFTAGASREFSQHGLSFNLYAGLYMSMIQAFDHSVTLDDSIQWIEANQGNPVTDPVSYLNVDGFVLARPILVLSKGFNQISISLQKGIKNSVYTLQRSLNLLTWDNVGNMIDGDMISDSILSDKQFYRLALP